MEGKRDGVFHFPSFCRMVEGRREKPGGKRLWGNGEGKEEKPGGRRREGILSSSVWSLQPQRPPG